MDNKTPRLLLVDDDRMALAILEDACNVLGYQTKTAANGAEAYTMIREDTKAFDVIMTDRMMPVMDGLALIRRLKRDADTADIPVILLTGASEPDDLRQGVEAGAFYYLTKPARSDVVGSVLQAAMKEVNRRVGVSSKLHSHQTAFGNIQILRMILRRPDEVEAVCSFLASLHDNPEHVVQGIYELVQNAVEHGVLRFGFDAKSKLIAQGGWDDALAARSRDPAYAAGLVEATMIRQENGLILTVKDNGPGFDWRPFIKADPARASLRCGLGISRANAYIFNKLAYNETGNEVSAVLVTKRQFSW